MDNEYLLTIFETLQEIKDTIAMIRTEPLLLTSEDIDKLEFNLGIINEYAKQVKRRE